MGSRHLSSLLLRPAPLSRVCICTSQPSTIRCLRLPPPSWVLPSTQRHLNTSRPTQPAQIKPKEPPKPLDTPANAEPTLTEEIDNLFGISKAPSSRTPSARRSNSGDDFAAARHLFGSEFSNPNSRANALKPQGLNFDELMMPEDTPEPVQVVEVPEEDIKYPRLNPAYGRTVNLDLEKGRDIVRGINMLGSLMARNKVKKDFNKQRYHERPGLKRKRLHSERWRARFKVGFDGVVGRVSELTRKGW
ncbi:hypothetical protein K505DRAFT_323110 [Melanomma pulvis-pyrius CBS 109.77]|uniref:Ribosomal protein S21 n=1 Tax=Melanomma pulvis-pyrius CBS 109.77 TaxID=1314802 RepID=A0A6A6XJM4_9PLEO|nr:hypothetical protein K505DRAFT_323110 [Melanomma pulvis-pyrius CBS 109.77]